MPDATTWLRRVSQNPEKYGTTSGHIKKVERDVARLLAASDAELARMEKRRDADE